MNAYPWLKKKMKIFKRMITAERESKSEQKLITLLQMNNPLFLNLC